MEQNSDALVVILAALLAVDGLVWSVGTLLPMLYALRNGALPIVFGIRLLSGPFENLGMEGLIPLSTTFIAVNALKIFAAYKLLQYSAEGAVLALILTALSAIFWYGFALPLGPLFGVLELVLIVLVWASLG